MNSATRPHYLLILFFVCWSGVLAAQWYPPYEDPKKDPEPDPVDTIYHYWIKFPADVRTECVKDVDIPGLEYDELGCDLLATGFSDERFEVGFDSSCYKIFRTYRIINWCEYDGEAAPVRVSRDWDSWNGTNPGRCDQPLPDGNNKPGDSDLYVHVYRHLNDNKADTVWYDADPDPHNEEPDNPFTKEVKESYWWRVISGGNDRFLESYYEGDCSTWSYDENQTDSDIAGNVFHDDDDYRFGSFGYWYYTQHIIVYDGIKPELAFESPDTFYSLSNADCAAEVSIAIFPSDSCSERSPSIEIYLDINNDGTLDEEVTEQWDGENFTGRYPIGQHRIEVEAVDNCGNEVTASRVFNIVDGLAPSPICHDGLTVELMAVEFDTLSPGIAVVWASDFVASPIYDCSGQDLSDFDENGNPLIAQYSINRVGESADIAMQSLTLTCDDLENGLIHIELHAWDTIGNHDFCQTFINVQDQSMACVPNAVEGTIATANHSLISGVEVQFNGDMEGMVLSSKIGTYEIPMGADRCQLEIRPTKKEGYMQGLSTLDLIQIQKHILGIELLDSPYSLIAADLDNNGKINLFDRIRMRKMLIGLETEMKHNEVWRFIPAQFEFDDPQNPWNVEFPETLHFETLDNNTPMNGDFVAIKIGDVNHSLGADDLEARSGKKMDLNIPDLVLEKGASYQIPLSIADAQQLDGLQFSLQWDPQILELRSIQPGLLAEEELLLDGKKGLLNAIWLNNYANDYTANLVLLEVRAKQTAKLSSLLTLSNRDLKPRAFTADKSILEIALKSVQKNLIAWTIAPNPFYEEAWLTFDEMISGQLEIYDVQGRMLYSSKLEKVNRQLIDRTVLGEAGLYFIKIKRAGQSDLVKEIILLDH